ncbi:MAG TPA: hypothetical protein VK570_09870 [Rubrivivax sp.]|nr:hypothetical protein [Rubrivivax sp.]
MESISFITWCIELEEHIAFNRSVVFELVNGAAYFEQQRGDGGIPERLGRLLTYADENTGVDANAGTAAAMQLAVLNLVYDNEWSVSEPGLFRDSSVYATEASALLAGAQTVTSSR